MTDSKTIQIFTDGACRGNPGPGGWGVLILAESGAQEFYGADEQTTNNRMELTAAIQGLTAVASGASVAIYTDSQYVKNGLESWIKAWKANGWRTSAKKPVKNQDLWRALDSAAQRLVVSWHWVKGHSGHPQNERADALANRAIDEMIS